MRLVHACSAGQAARCCGMPHLASGLSCIDNQQSTIHLVLMERQLTIDGLSMKTDLLNTYQ
jgi:hypothetical protein